MELGRTQLIIEMARPSVSVTGRSKPRTVHGQRRRYNAQHDHHKPKARTRNISSRRKLGSTRPGLVSRLLRRVTDKMLPSAAQLLRGRQQIKQKRRRGEGRYSHIPGKISLRTTLMKGRRL